MRVLSAILALGIVLIAATASAQTADPIITHYRAYNAAMARNDLAAAETEAAAALAASEAANGPRTGVLALNLALVRASRNDLAGALAPAQQAFALSERGAAGVDPMLAALTLGRAELGTSGQAGATRLQALLADARLSAVPLPDVYFAAAQLGAWAHNNGQFQIAENAWAIAAQYAAGSPLGEPFTRAHAQTQQASAVIMEEIGQRGRHRMNRDRAYEAYALLNDAIITFTPIAEVDLPNGELTVAQRAYANALVWRGTLSTKMRSDGQRLPDPPLEAQGDADGVAELAPRDLTSPRCMLDLDPGSRPESLYPSSELATGGIGAVVVHFQLDESGAIARHQVVANTGSERFAQSIQEAAGRWRFSRNAESPTPCRVPVNILRSVIFVMGSP